VDTIDLPVPSLVVLIGASGAGKTTLAARLFAPTEILSSDDLRAAVSGDAADQRATRSAFQILHREVRRRLAAGRLVVVDATNVEAGARHSLLRLARDGGAPATAIVLLTPADVAHARNARRAGRIVPRAVVDRHLARVAALGQTPDEITARLRTEGFAGVHVLATVDEVDALPRIRRVHRAIVAPDPIRDDPSATTILTDLVAELGATLGSEMIGAYLTGSAVTGGYDRDVSDLDIVVVTSGQLEANDLAALEAMHHRIKTRHPGWDDRLEIVYLAGSTLRSFRTSHGRLAVMSPGEPFHVRTERADEWLQNWYLVREAGIALRGPLASAVIPPIDWAEFVTATARYARHLAGADLRAISPGAVAYAVLTMCRAAMTVAIGESGSKQAAAAWAAEALPESHVVIDAALRSRLSGGTTGFANPGDRAAAAALIAELARLIDRGAAEVEAGLSPP
jgi:predicted kinase/predicted nucleotidyltransferase